MPVEARKKEIAVIFLAAVATTGIILFGTSLDKANIEVVDQYLVIESPYLAERFRVDLIPIDRIREVELDRKSPFWPRSRIQGNSKTRQGLFRLSNGERAFVETGGEGVVLYVPLSSELVLLYRTVEPDLFLDSLRGHLVSGRRNDEDDA